LHACSVLEHAHACCTLVVRAARSGALEGRSTGYRSTAYLDRKMPIAGAQYSVRGRAPVNNPAGPLRHKKQYRDREKYGDRKNQTDRRGAGAWRARCTTANGYNMRDGACNARQGL